MHKLFRHGTIVFGGIIAGYGATYVYYVACARALGVDRYGLLSSLLAVALLGSLPASFVTIVIAKAAATYKATGDLAALATIATRSSRAALPVAAVAALLTLAGGGAFGSFFRLDDGVAMWLLAAATALLAVLPLQRAVLQGAGNFAAFAVSAALEGGVRAAVGLIVLSTGGGIRLAIAAFVLAGLAAYAADIYFLHRAAPVRDRSKGTLHLGDAALTALPIAAITLMTFADVVVVRHSLVAYEAGLYATVSLIGRALITVITTVPTVLLPAAVARAIEGRSSMRLLGGALAVATCAALVTVSICAWNAPMVLDLLGGRAYVAGAPLVVPYALAASALAGATIIATYLSGIHRTFVGIPLAAIAIFEPIAILLWARNAQTAVALIDFGHASALLACCIALAIAVLPRGLSRTASQRI